MIREIIWSWVRYLEGEDMRKLICNFIEDKSGATAIEYGLIAALISVALITGATALGNSLNSQFNGISTKLNLS